MLPTQLRMTLIIAIAVFFVIVLWLLKNKRLALKYTLLWLVTGAVMLIFAIFPGILLDIAKLLGIQTVMNTLYVLALSFILMLIMMLTSIVSSQTDRIRKLAQSQALLEERDRQVMKRARELEEELRKFKGSTGSGICYGSAAADVDMESSNGNVRTNSENGKPGGEMK